MSTAPRCQGNKTLLWKGVICLPGCPINKQQTFGPPLTSVFKSFLCVFSASRLPQHRNKLESWDETDDNNLGCVNLFLFHLGKGKLGLDRNRQIRVVDERPFLIQFGALVRFKYTAFK
jgi:hypothetical protein